VSNGHFVLESRSFKEEKGLQGMRHRRGPEANAFLDLRTDIDRAFVRLEAEVSALNPYLGSSPTDPVGTFVGGEMYFNTVLNRLMYYDPSRSKWLSVDAASMLFGRQGFTAAGSYFRTVDGLTFTSTLGFNALQNGTVVGFGYTRDNTSSATFGGTTDAFDLDFNQGDILGIRNKTGGNNVQRANGILIVKWRA
jgi:hypothetical protein